MGRPRVLLRRINLALCGLNGYSGCCIRCVEVGGDQLFQLVVKLKYGTNITLEATHDASRANVPVPADHFTVKCLKIAAE